MVISRWSVWDELADLFEQSYEHAVVYEDTTGDVVIYEGSVRFRANGWLEVEGDRLLSPAVVGRVDVQDDTPATEADDTDSDRER